LVALVDVVELQDGALARPEYFGEVEVLEVVELAVWVEEEEEELSPGIVAALTALKTPTPATAANAAPVVSRWSRLRAASRARTRSDVWLVRSMVKSLGKPSRPYI